MGYSHFQQHKIVFKYLVKTITDIFLDKFFAFILQMISAEAPVLFAKAAEIFVSELSLRAWFHTEENKRRTLQVCAMNGKEISCYTAGKATIKDFTRFWKEELDDINYRVIIKHL